MGKTMTDQEIKPRMVDGVGYCSMECPQFSGPDHDRYDGSCPMADDHVNTGEVCPVWTQRMAAWAEEARCAIEDELRSFVSGEEKQTWRMIDSLLSRYPGKDGE